MREEEEEEEERKNSVSETNKIITSKRTRRAVSDSGIRADTLEAAAYAVTLVHRFASDAILDTKVNARANAPVEQKEERKREEGDEMNVRIKRW